MKQSGGLLLADIVLDRTSSVPLYRQLHLQIRQQVLDGRLPAGTRLPSTRTLIRELEVSRITIVICPSGVNRNGPVFAVGLVVFGVSRGSQCLLAVPSTRGHQAQVVVAIPHQVSGIPVLMCPLPSPDYVVLHDISYEISRN